MRGLGESSRRWRGRRSDCRLGRLEVAAMHTSHGISLREPIRYEPLYIEYLCQSPISIRLVKLKYTLQNAKDPLERKVKLL
jgi:hypothetical protein